MTIINHVFVILYQHTDDYYSDAIYKALNENHFLNINGINSWVITFNS